MNKGKLEKVAEKGLDVISMVLSSEEPTKEQLTQARLASSVVSSSIRLEAAQNARIGMQIRVAGMVLKDDNERKKYLKAASPELKLISTK